MEDESHPSNELSVHLAECSTMIIEDMISNHGSSEMP